MSFRSVLLRNFKTGGPESPHFSAHSGSTPRCYFLCIQPCQHLATQSPLDCFASPHRNHFMNKSPTRAWQLCPNPYHSALHTLLRWVVGGLPISQSYLSLLLRKELYALASVMGDTQTESVPYHGVVCSSPSFCPSKCCVFTNGLHFRKNVS